MLKVEEVSLSVPLGVLSVFLIENGTVLGGDSELKLPLRYCRVPILVHFDVINDH